MIAPFDPGNVKVYTVNGPAAGSSSSLPDWLTRKRAAGKGSRKRVTRELAEGTIELIQGFEFPEASIRIKTTRDGHHAIATGTYKPQMKVWDLNQLSQKFERHSDAENVDFIVRESSFRHFLRLPQEFQVAHLEWLADLVGRLDEINSSPERPHHRAPYAKRLSSQNTNSTVRSFARIPFPFM